MSDGLSDIVRSKRDFLLSQCDWTHMISDMPVPQKEEWAAYRQALRDITKQEGFPEDVIWPEEPRPVYVEPAAEPEAPAEPE